MAMANTPHANKDILIVDDDHDIVNALETILSMEGYTTHKAFLGRECLEQIKKQKPDLLLLDYMLPDIAGKDVVNAIRQHDSLASLPIILISAAHGVEEIGRNLAIQDWIEKPFELDHLLKVVGKYV